MNRYGQRIRKHIDAELRAAALAESERPDIAFAHLERAHVLGQASTIQHVRVHWQMLRWGLRQRDLREGFGQLLRIIGAASKTAIGLVPSGNTGGARVSPFQAMPVPPELASMMREAGADIS